MDLTSTTLFSLDMSGQYLIDNQPGFSSDEIFDYIIKFPVHVIPMVYSDGTASDHGQQGWGVENQPFNMLNNSGYNKTWSYFLQTKLALEQRLDFLTEGLKAKGSISFDSDSYSTMARYKTPETFYAENRNQDGSLNKKMIKSGTALGNPQISGTGGSKRIYIETSLNYDYTFRDLHEITALALYMQKENQYQNRSGVQLLPYRKQSFVTRITYGYDNRYLVEASMGMTGSENFAKGNRWGQFPAIGIAWFASHEKFMRPFADILNKLKIRASYGITGNDNIGDARFPYRGTINTGAAGYNLGFTPGNNGGPSNYVGDGVVEGQFTTPNLSWETEIKRNIGVDLGLFQGRFDLSLDLFSNKRDQILLQRRTVSEVTGFRETPYQNFGVVHNKGIDGNLIFRHNIGELDMTFRGSLTYAKNQIKEYDEIPQRYEYQNYTGNSIGTPLLYVAEGLYTPDDFIITKDENGGEVYSLKEDKAIPSANVAPGDIKYSDINGDGVIDDYDRTYEHGHYSETPDLVYGFGTSFGWKGFFCGVFFQGTGNASINLATNGDIIPFYRGADNSSARAEVFDRWNYDNAYDQDVLFPRLHSDGFDHNMYGSTWWYRNASFLRLKNVEIGYEFDKEIVERIKFNNIRIYFQGNNLAIWDKVKLWDPELGHANSGAKYPMSSYFVFGVDLTF